MPATRMAEFPQKLRDIDEAIRTTETHFRQGVAVPYRDVFVLLDAAREWQRLLRDSILH